MNNFPWLPLGTYIRENMSSGKLIRQTSHYQLIEVHLSDKVGLVLPMDIEMFSFWRDIIYPMLELKSATIVTVLNRTYVVWPFDKESIPLEIQDIATSYGILSARKLFEISDAIRGLPECDWASALYLPSENVCLPMKWDQSSLEEKQLKRKELIFKLLTGGITLSSLNDQSVLSYNHLLTLSDINEIHMKLNLDFNKMVKIDVSRTVSDFKLPGKSQLESFFNEYIIDYYNDFEKYSSFGVKPVNGILLYGPPGTGKTYACEKLAEHLNWFCQHINFSEIGSPYIHQTGLKLKQAFDVAARNAPSILIMDELDAMTLSRDKLEHSSGVEEISELLRLLEKASSKKILVIGTTNRLHAIDPAILRKGRIDHKILVDYPSYEEIISVIKFELSFKDSEGSDIFLPYISELSSRPLSDIAWVINEAARITVRCGRTKIEAWAVKKAVEHLCHL